MAKTTDSSYCWNCGKRVQGKSENCPFCGAAYEGKDKYGRAPVQGAGGVGWSDRADDPFFKQYAGKYSLTSIIWMMALSVLIPGLLLATGQIKAEGEGLAVMIAVPAVVWLIGAVFLIKRYGGRDKSWDGRVTDKTKTEVTRFERVTEYGRKHWRRVKHMQYEIFFRTVDGGNRRMEYWDNAWAYRYLNVGELVRVHRKKYLKYIEKYDKTREADLPCAACGYPNDVRGNYCELCGAPLLKGRADLPAADVPDGAGHEAPAEGAPRCKACGAPLTGGNFCTSCGAKVE